MEWELTGSLLQPERGLWVGAASDNQRFLNFRRRCSTSPVHEAAEA